MLFRAMSYCTESRACTGRIVRTDTSLRMSETLPTVRVLHANNEVNFTFCFEKFTEDLVAVVLPCCAALYVVCMHCSPADGR